ncbi:hypothetical protein H5410_062519 [Solanum commersonii]|uniref:Uncharacterized protein n=1 Tax=Solanum commersonii TaxID=4109 RepID=A0A9J5WAW5_SOLCO|nr:hypothetical protein H5410_062519 [Solanum commersonii]
MSEKPIDFSLGSPARKNISKEFQESKWKPFRKWFFKNFDEEEQKNFQEEFYIDVIETKKNVIISFVPWFMCKYVHNFISIIEKDFTLSNGEITKSVFPPLQSFQISKNDRKFNFNVFSKLFENDIALVTTHHINAMIKQNNYANFYMSILSEHIVTLHDKVDKLISQLNFDHKGKGKVAQPSIQPPLKIEDFKLKDFSDLESFLERTFKGNNLKPLKLNNQERGESSKQMEFPDEIKRSQKSMPGSQFKGYRQIYTTMHKMLMYSTICKTNKNSDKTITDMITAGFTSQLKGWWDNYLNQQQRDTILQEVKVMELPECNNTHWKSKFIDGLSSLFAERVRKSLKGEGFNVNYDDYTYGKLISACVQEGISLCNEIKLNQQIKRHCLNERQ